MFYRLISCVLLVGLLLIACEEEETPTPNPDFVYFLVGEKNANNNDSYILPLLDPVDIEKARAIAAGTAEPQIILAEITRNKNVNYYVNKDLVGENRWSWHVAEFMGFVDNTIEIYDGWPGYVEEHYSEWVDDTKGANGRGRIGFWDYTIIREVELSEL